MHEHADLDISGLSLARVEPRYLLFLPLAYVAAASRRRDLALLDRLIESSARTRGIDGEGVELARRWVRQPPTPAEFADGLARLRDACHGAQAAGLSTLAVRDLIEAVLWACSAAQLDRERIGRRYTPVSTSARRSIGELEAALGVEVGELWADVLEELGEQLPRSQNVLPPRVRTGPDSQRRAGGAPDSAPGSVSGAR
jgi:hypothetical protein